MLQLVFRSGFFPRIPQIAIITYPLIIEYNNIIVTHLRAPVYGDPKTRSRIYGGQA